jgi:L-amino acid N-acyltransferase YncA
MIRAAIAEDIDSVVNIYNQAIDAGFQTAFTEKFSAAERMDWFQQHLENNFPIFVYVIEGEVAGWFSISPYRQGRDALRYTVEISYFVHRDHQKKGIGSQLMKFGLDACRQLGYKTALAIILEPNTGSIRLLEKSGFERWAYLPGVAVFKGVECSHIYYGIKL